MPSWNDIEFRVQRSDVTLPLWERAIVASHEQVPFGVEEDVQFLGAGNYRLTLPVIFDSLDDLNAVRSGMTSFTAAHLDAVDASADDVVVMGVSGVRRYYGDDPGAFFATLELERQGD